MKISAKNGTFYCISRPGKLVTHYIRYSIPTAWRRFDDGQWWVHESKLLNTIQLGFQVHGSVDYSIVDPNLKKQIDEQAKGWNYERDVRDVPAKVDLAKCYEQLHLLSSAPDFVLEAAWKSIVKNLHPDKAPSREKEFRKYKEAYEIIKANKKPTRTVERK